MIHTYLVLAIAASALILRWQWHHRYQRSKQSGELSIRWYQQWWWALVALALPPLWLLNSWIAVLLMGHAGTMWGCSVGTLGSILAIAGLAWAVTQLAIAWRQGQQSVDAIVQLPTVKVQGQAARLIDQPTPYAAQVGFWRSHLVVSQGFLDHLSPAQVKAVLAHEGAHASRRDTFTFFWLSWLHRLVSWLPGSGELWQELLLLREIHADHHAAQTTDPLDVAEALLLMVRFPQESATAMTATMSNASELAGDRLNRRIQSLIQQTQHPTQAAPKSLRLRLASTLWCWGLMSFAACPLLETVLHH
ncbi:MAG: M56 family metallopeptidase [Cyanobacteria bacterium P01_D01_bin.73]